MNPAEISTLLKETFGEKILDSKAGWRKPLERHRSRRPSSKSAVSSGTTSG